MGQKGRSPQTVYRGDFAPLEIVQNTFFPSSAHHFQSKSSQKYKYIQSCSTLPLYLLQRPTPLRWAKNFVVFISQLTHLQSFLCVSTPFNIYRSNIFPLVTVLIGIQYRNCVSFPRALCRDCPKKTCFLYVVLPHIYLAIINVVCKVYAINYIV